MLCGSRDVYRSFSLYSSKKKICCPSSPFAKYVKNFHKYHTFTVHFFFDIELFCYHFPMFGHDSIHLFSVLFFFYQQIFHHTIALKKYSEPILPNEFMEVDTPLLRASSKKKIETQNILHIIDSLYRTSCECFHLNDYYRNVCHRIAQQK